MSLLVVCVCLFMISCCPYAIEPLYNSVPAAAKSDSLLYEYLALVDALRIGRARERRFAEEELKHRLKQYNVQRRLSS